MPTSGSPPASPRTRSTRSAKTSLRWIAELAAERGITVQIHLSETEQEVADCLAARGERPAHYLDRVGLLTPRTVLSHGVWLDEAELELIAARGAVIVTNPVANLKLAVGRVFPYLRARAAGIQVGLGTDGPGSNNSLDLFADMKVFALLQKHEARDSAAITAEETWEIATGRRAPLLGAAHRLEVGQPADFLLLRRRRPRAQLRRAARRARLRRVGRGRPDHGGGRAGAHAGRRDRGRRGGARPARSSAPGGSVWPPQSPPRRTIPR